MHSTQILIYKGTGQKNSHKNTKIVKHIIEMGSNRVNSCKLHTSKFDKEINVFDVSRKKNEAT